MPLMKAILKSWHLTFGYEVHKFITFWQAFYSECHITIVSIFIVVQWLIFIPLRLEEYFQVGIKKTPVWSHIIHIGGRLNHHSYLYKILF